MLQCRPRGVWTDNNTSPHIGYGFVTYAQEGLQTDTVQARSERTSLEDDIDFRGLDSFLNQ